MDLKFEMIGTQKSGWLSFKNVIKKFLGNFKSPDWIKGVSGIVDSFQKLKPSMSLKLHFIDSYIEYFPENLEDYSEEQGERFHQNITVMEQRYQGRWNENKMADYCWMLKRDAPQKERLSRKMQLQRSFECKRVHYNNKKIAVLSYSRRRRRLI